jgi:putative pyruvate formate lyase activating enzyme
MSRSLLSGQLRRELLSSSITTNTIKANHRSAVGIVARPNRLRKTHGALPPAAAIAVQRRGLHLAPPFLLDEPYIPRYQTLSAKDAALKRSRAYGHLRNCNLCPRLCGVNRYETTGMCLIGDKAKVNVIAPHFGEGMLACLLLVLSAL